MSKLLTGEVVALRLEAIAEIAESERTRRMACAALHKARSGIPVETANALLSGVEDALYTEPAPRGGCSP